MKIGILGASGAGLAALRISLANIGHEVIVITEDDADLSNKVIAMCGHPLANVGIDIYPEQAKEYIDNTFRGGSRGKGGKIKYRRG